MWERVRVHGYLCGDVGLRAWARACEPMVCVDAGLRAVSPSVGLTGPSAPAPWRFLKVANWAEDELGRLPRMGWPAGAGGARRETVRRGRARPGLLGPPVFSSGFRGPSPGQSDSRPRGKEKFGGGGVPNCYFANCFYANLLLVFTQPIDFFLFFWFFFQFKEKVT